MVGKVTLEDRYYFPTGSVKVPPEGRYYFPTGSVILPHGVVNRWTLPHRAYFSWKHCCQAVSVPPTAASHGTLPPVEGLTFPHRVGIVCLQGRYSKLIAVYLVSFPSWLHTGFPTGSVFSGRSHVPRTSCRRSSQKFTKESSQISLIWGMRLALGACYCGGVVQSGGAKAKADAAKERRLRNVKWLPSRTGGTISPAGI
jgi:hypothetical protein